MKNALKIINILIVILILSSCQQKVIINRMVHSKKDGEMLLGHQSLEQFKKEKFSKWYNEEHEAYPVSEESIKALKKANIGTYKITVFIGTWCSDSQREFPRLVKILEKCNYPMNRLVIIGVNRKKQSPSGEEGLFNIEKVPTIIVEKYGAEKGRIIEQTESGFIEKDLLKILEKAR